MKTRTYEDDIGKHYKMTDITEDDGHYYRCHDGRELWHICTEQHQKEGYTQTYEVWLCGLQRVRTQIKLPE